MYIVHCAVHLPPPRYVTDMLLQIRPGQSWDRIRANLLFVLSASDTRVMVVVVPIVPYVAFAPTNDRLRSF